jgi:hypothetical protein
LVFGPHSFDGSTVLYGHASGVTPPPGRSRPPGAELDLPLRVWVRDSRGWHATRANARRWSAEEDSAMTLRLEIVPPLSRATTWIEILAAGPSAQARTTLPLRWQ